MKKIFLLIPCILLINLAFAQNFTDIKLPEPDKSGGKPLMEALNNRQTIREFGTEEFSIQQISDLLWAACGINRPEESKRTVPSAMNDQEIDVYVVLKNGIYLYDAPNNALKAIKEGDFRANMGRQDFVAIAPVVLVYVADFGRMAFVMDKRTKIFYSATDTGFISQNVYLYASSENLATVVIGYINKGKISKAIGLSKNQHPILSQPVGFRKD